MKRGLVWGLLLLLVILLSGVVFVWLGADWRAHWGATAEEVAMPLPGDELVENPVVVTTRAITIHADRSEIWPWLIQMGQDRGGFYTHTFFENAVGLQIYNAWKIQPEWQDVSLDDPFYLANTEGFGKMRVAILIPDSAFVVMMDDVPMDSAEAGSTDSGWTFVWAFTLHPGSRPGTSRFVIRESVKAAEIEDGFGSQMLGLVSWIMESGTLRGVKIRAEKIRQ